MKIKNTVSEKILVLLIAINIISFISVISFNIYNRAFFYINFFMICTIILIQNKFYKNDIKLIIFSIFFATYGLFTLLITGGGVGSVLTAFYSILVYFAIKKTYINDKNIKIIMYLMVFLNLFLTINSPNYYSKWYFNRDYYINSNTIGMVIMYTAMYSSIFLKRLEIKKARFYIIVIYTLSIIGILNVQSRGALLTLMSFIILDISFLKKIWKNIKFTKISYMIILVIGSYIPYMYTQLYNSGKNFVIPFTSKSMYTGREFIWNNFYNEISKNNLSVLWGLGSKADLGGGKSLNLHNNYLAVIANFGVIGFILYYGFWFFQIRLLLNRGKIGDYQISLLLVFFAILINGFIEVSTLWHVMFFFNFMSLGLAHKEEEKYLIDI